jgi:hypothetical protein
LNDLPALMHRPPYKTALIVAVLAVAIVAGLVIARSLQGGSSSSSADASLDAPITDASLDNAVQGLCSVGADLEAGDVDQARAVFYDKSHLFLHQLGAAIQDMDRDRATSLLTAKYRVEGLVDGSAAVGGEDPSTAVPALLQEVAASASILGLTAPGC